MVCFISSMRWWLALESSNHAVCIITISSWWCIHNSRSTIKFVTLIYFRKSRISKQLDTCPGLSQNWHIGLFETIFEMNSEVICRYYHHFCFFICLSLVAVVEWTVASCKKDCLENSWKIYHYVSLKHLTQL